MIQIPFQLIASKLSSRGKATVCPTPDTCVQEGNRFIFNRNGYARCQVQNREIALAAISCQGFDENVEVVTEFLVLAWCAHVA